MSSPSIHIIEPTLHNRAGHCYSHILALLEANEQLPHPARLHLWAGKGAEGMFADYESVTVHPHFSQLLKRFQTLLLYRRMLREQATVYLLTASRRDLVMLNLATRKRIPANKIFMLFHWLKLSPAKRKNIEKIACRQPNLVTMGPTKPIADILRSCGFSHARVVPYPITPVRLPPGTELSTSFRYVLFGGAAREDKGIRHVVDFVEHLSKRAVDVPVLVQTSPPHKGAHPESIQDLLKRLKQSQYPHLQIKTDTLSQQAYFEQYGGAITLQLYDPKEYADDRISGVTLDALSCGSPIITMAGTWMGRVVNRFGAGLTLDTPTPENVEKAVLTIQKNFSTYREKAVRAGEVLQKEHNAENILNVILAGTVDK